MPTEAPALRLEVHHVSRAGEPVFDIVTLRRAEFLLRYSRYRGAVVDERLLTRVFKVRSTRGHAAILLDGTLDLFERLPLRVSAGDSVLFGARGASRARWDGATAVELEWVVGSGQAAREPRRLAAPDLDVARELCAALENPAGDQRRALGLAFELFRSIGAPVQLDIRALTGAPTERDRRLAFALSEQVNCLASRATTLYLGESAKLSPRQLQRVVDDFNARYGVNAGNWRDWRNRWRLQVAVMLLSRAGYTVADVAAEVGYRSPNALARAFARSGFPQPAQVRALLRPSRVR